MGRAPGSFRDGNCCTLSFLVSCSKWVELLLKTKQTGKHSETSRCLLPQGVGIRPTGASLPPLGSSASRGYCGDLLLWLQCAWPLGASEGKVILRLEPGPDRGLVVPSHPVPFLGSSRGHLGVSRMQRS